MTVNAALGWSALFLTLILMTDIPATASIAAGLAWLILIAVLLEFGPKAFDTVTAVQTHGGGGGTPSKVL